MVDCHPLAHDCYVLSAAPHFRLEINDRMKSLIILLSGLFIAQSAIASADIEVLHPYVQASKPNDLSAPVYAQIVNNSNKDRVLVSATSTAATKTELYDQVSRGGTDSDRKAPFFTIPAQNTLQLSQDTSYIQLIGLVKPLEKNKHIQLTLNFKNGEQLTLRVPITIVVTDIMHQKAKMDQ